MRAGRVHNVAALKMSRGERFGTLLPEWEEGDATAENSSEKRRDGP